CIERKRTGGAAIKMKTANQAAAVNAPVALRFQVWHFERRVTEQQRSVNERCRIRYSLWPSVSSVPSVLTKTVESPNVRNSPDVRFAQTQSTGQFLNTELTEDTEVHG